MHCLYETHFKYNETNRLKVKGLTIIHHSNTSQKKGGVVT